MAKRDHFLTAEGATRLRKELELLKGPRRTELAGRLRHAVQMGDLSENADYTVAKEDQAFLEGRILELETIWRGRHCGKLADAVEGARRRPSSLLVGEADPPGRIARVSTPTRSTLPRHGCQMPGGTLTSDPGSALKFTTASS
jgi:hypothetical protein